MSNFVILEATAAGYDGARWFYNPYQSIKLWYGVCRGFPCPPHKERGGKRVDEVSQVCIQDLFQSCYRNCYNVSMLQHQTQSLRSPAQLSVCWC